MYLPTFYNLHFFVKLVASVQVTEHFFFQAQNTPHRVIKKKVFIRNVVDLEALNNIRISILLNICTNEKVFDS